MKPATDKDVVLLLRKINYIFHFISHDATKTLFNHKI